MHDKKEKVKDRNIEDKIKFFIIKLNVPRTITYRGEVVPAVNSPGLN